MSTSFGKIIQPYYLDNILSNNDHPYFADFGLALSKEFELSPQEKAFFETHKDYDRSYVAGALALETLALCAGERFEKEEDLYLSSGKTNIQLPLEAHEITARYQKFAKIMGDFLKNLRSSQKAPHIQSKNCRKHGKKRKRTNGHYSLKNLQRKVL